MTRYPSIAAATLALSCAALPAPAADNVDLRPTRIALFSSGVGYFECAAEVQGDTTAELKFRTDQINDILKSLIVRDLSGGTIGVVGYASRDPVEKALRSFGVDITGKPTLGQLLDQLRGEPIEIAAPRRVAGVIVGVERQKKRIGEETIEFDALTLLTDAGLEQLDLTGVQGLRLTNDKIAAELRGALATLAGSHAADKKSVLIQFNGQGQRQVRAAYLLEAPIWKTSYRLALPSTGESKPLLQGWATVENATEEDWKDVKLSLVSGRPISFLMDLYTPLYVPRPRVELELYASLRPPEMEAEVARRETAGERLLDRDVDAAMKFSKPPPSAARPGRSRRTPAEAAGADAIPADAFGEVASVAEAQEAGELFEYAINTPVSIARQHSAMLPIVNEEIAGEKLSVYNAATHAKHPLNALRVENTTKLHLMQGPVTLFDSGLYAGDAKLPDLKPGEKRLIGYALDLGVEVNVESKPLPEELVSLRINRGALWMKHKYLSETTYGVKNKTDKPRIVLLEHPSGEDWKLIEPDKPEERTPNLLRFKLTVPPRESQTQKVRLERLGDQTVVLADAGFDFIEFYLRSKVISPAVKAALERVVALRTNLHALESERARAEQRLNEAVTEQARVRENVKTLEKGSDAYARQLKKFDDLESKIEASRADLETKRTAEAEQKSELENYLATLDVE